MSDWQVVEGDCVEQMALLPEASVDAIVTDPPYGLEFMGKDWDGANGFRRSLNANDVGRDNAFGRTSARGPEYRAGHSFQAFSEAWGREALRVLRPGGYILAFGGTRTYHRLASGLEDAGFEVRDMVEWLYGSGFPKHESCLKPAHEPIMLGRKAAPRSAPLQIDACRIAGDEDGSRNRPPSRLGSDTTYAQDEWTRNAVVERRDTTGLGRWPANAVLDGDAAKMLDTQSGDRKAGGNLSGEEPSRPAKNTYGEYTQRREWDSYGDSGGASRFFYCAKAGRGERNAGLDGFEERIVPVGNQRPGEHGGLRDKRLGDDYERPLNPVRNVHPTVKPIDLMRWLCRLITPPGGTVLDPFTGSGTTGCAAALEGIDFIGIECEAEYAAIARARIAHWWKQPVQLGLEAA